MLPDASIALAVLFVLLLAERGLELGINRRNVRKLLALGAVRHAPDGFALILASQVAWIAGLAIEGLVLERAAWNAVSAFFVGGFLAAQGLRYWCIATLGTRWSMVVLTLPNQPLVTRGPYRFLRHPNYVAVALELVCLPLAFGLWATAVIGAAWGGLALLVRIRREEAALRPQRATPTS